MKESKSKRAWTSPEKRKPSGRELGKKQNKIVWEKDKGLI